MVISRAKVIGNLDLAREQFVDGYPWLTRARDHFQAAMSYYQEHQDEIDGEIQRQNRLLALLDKYSDPQTHILDMEAVMRDPLYESLIPS